MNRTGVVLHLQTSPELNLTLNYTVFCIFVLSLFNYALSTE